jgi:glycosyltransferase involved in cell wall biosynthesis
VAYLLADAGIPLRDSRKGSSIHARSMIRAFEQEGCDIDVYVMRKGRGPETATHVVVVRQSRLTRWWLTRWLEQGLWRRLWPGAAGRATPPNWMTAIGWLLWHKDFYRTVCAKVRRARPDLLYARSAWFSWPYLKLKQRLGVPLYLEVNAVFLIEKRDRAENAFDRLQRRIEGALMRGADYVLPVSAAIKQQIIDVYGIAPEKIVVTPNAVDLEHFSPTRRVDHDPQSRFVIGAVNSMRAYHGMGTLLAAAAQLRPEFPQLRLLLIGGGELLDQLRAQACDLGLADITEFTGVIDHAQVPVRLGECDLCVAPYEGEFNQYNCPMKLYEYMAMKIPLVASRWGDIPTIIDDGRTGLLHNPADPADLAQKIRDAFHHRAEATQRAEAAYKIVERHTWRSIARRILAWQPSSSPAQGH